MADLGRSVIDIVAALSTATSIFAAARGDAEVPAGLGGEIVDIAAGDLLVFVVPLVEFAPVTRDALLAGLLRWFQTCGNPKNNGVLPAGTGSLDCEVAGPHHVLDNHIDPLSVCHGVCGMPVA